jgi:hypothetical protein
MVEGGYYAQARVMYPCAESKRTPPLTLQISDITVEFINTREVTILAE